jgi:nucleotide-binding universal stress UspA family protein
VFKRILLAYDGSREGALALREGALLARSCGAQVHLLAVVPSAAGVQIAESVYGGVVAQLAATHRPLFKRAVQVLRDLRFDPIACLEVGEPGPIIGQMARYVGADLVIARHNPQSLLSRLWDGSADAHLSRYVNCSLLLSNNQVSDEEFDAEVRRTAPPRPRRRTFLTANLRATLQQAAQVAAAGGHEYTTLEHLLLALADDDDAAAVLEACQVNRRVLRATLARYIDQEPGAATDRDQRGEQPPTASVHRVIQRAADHVQSSGRDDVTGANVLTSIFSERDSRAAYFLNQQGMNRDDAVNFIAHGISKGGSPH